MGKYVQTVPSLLERNLYLEKKIESLKKENKDLKEKVLEFQRNQNGDHQLMTIESHGNKAGLLYFQYKEQIQQKFEEIRKLNEKCSELHYHLLLQTTQINHVESESESNEGEQFVRQHLAEKAPSKRASYSRSQQALQKEEIEHEQEELHLNGRKKSKRQKLQQKKQQKLAEEQSKLAQHNMHKLAKMPNQARFSKVQQKGSNPIQKKTEKEPAFSEQISNVLSPDDHQFGGRFGPISMRNIERIQEQLKKNTQELSSLKKQRANIEKELLAFTTKLPEESQKKQVKVDIKKHPQYGKYITQNQKGNLHLTMQSENVTDKMVQEIAQCDLSRIQLLWLYGNKITDRGFNLLLHNREWPVLQTIQMSNNKIQNIHSLHKIPNLQDLFIHRNELSFDSCIYLCENQWPELTMLWISFKLGVNDKCWEKLVTVMKEKFPKIQDLQLFQVKDVSSKNQEKIQKYCEKNSIKFDSNS